MYCYKKEKKFPKRKMLVFMSCLLMITAAYLTYEYSQTSSSDATSVFKEETTPVISLPDTTKKEEKASKPFLVNAEVVLDYYDGTDTDVASMTKFEGVYRGNQGMDFAYENQAFDVVSCFSGEVSEVKEDSMFGKSVTITTKDIAITYQSIDDVKVKKGDQVKQGDVIAKAGTNIYNKDLNNHLHMVVEKNGKLMDPETIFGKTVDEIK